MTQRRFFLVALLFARTFLVAVSQNYTAYWPYCSTTGNYTMASSYQVNLVKLMGDLQAGAIANWGFNVSTAGSFPDTVFGLVMCYADRSWDECQKCVRAATAGVQQTCPYSRQMKACYDACVLRYSNESFFSVADLNVAFYLWKPAYVNDMVGMNATRRMLMSGLMGDASEAPLRLANQSMVFTDSDGSLQPMYGLAQCTRDLKASGCTRCLAYLVAELSRSRPNHTFGAVKGYSCYVEYQIGKDLGIMLPRPPSPAEPPEPSPPPRPPSPAVSPELSPLPRPATTPRPEATWSPPHGLDGGRIAAATLGLLCATVALGFLAAFFWRLWRKDAAPEQDLGGARFDGEPQEEEFEKGAGPKRFHYRDLAVATRNFSEEEKLGEGGFGSVYHGYLKDVDLHVAIKRVSKNSKQGRKEYESEVKIISGLRHRNLVELIGWCHAGEERLIAGATVGSLAGAIALCVFAAFIWRRMGRDATAPELELGSTRIDSEPQEVEFEKGAGPKRFHYRDLAVATRNFSEEEKLGEGGFGSVYHGYLKDLDLHVAIKRVSKNSKQGRKEYESVVMIISRLRHRNLVELIGCCHAGEELLLVYELMPNGSLDTHIHNTEKILSWPIRREMVLGVGSALQYLHQDCKECVVHRDIKPSNIMLDATFNAKLGDFGLARLIDHGRGSHTTVLAGTIGYMDPECMVTGNTSIQSDVYSFGVLLLKIACGRPAIVAGVHGTTIHLVHWVWEFFSRGKILDAADPRLNGEFDAVEMESVMVTALWCAHPDRIQRPPIREAMNVLRLDLDAQLPSLPAEMPVAKFVPPQSLLDNFVSGTTTGSFVSVTETSSLLR